MKRAARFIGVVFLLNATAVEAQSSPPSAAAKTGSQTLATSQPFAIEGPSSLVLGRDASATLRLRAPDHAKFRLYTNIGTLGPPVRVGAGRFEVTYTPPEEKYPQVAIVALAGDGEHLAWTQIALHGVARVELNSDPEVMVEVRVADAGFGPVKTDRRGQASIPVVVPPGTVDAVSIATDALGNQRQQTIPIQVPPFQRLLSVCSASNGRSFWVFAVDAHGRPQPSAAVRAEASPLRVSGIEARAPGVYRVALDIPPQVKAGDLARLEATLIGESVSRHACELRVPLEAPDRIDLALSRPSFRAGDETSLWVHVMTHYVGAREPEATELELEPSIGRLEPARARAGAPIALRWFVPNALSQLTAATLRVRAGEVSAQLSLALRAGPLAKLKVDSADPRLPANELARTTLRVDALDAFGNPIRDAELSAAASGEVGRFEQTGPGHYEARYRAPRVGLDDRIRIRARGSAVIGELRLPLYAESGFSLGGRAGFIGNFGRISAPIALLQLGHNLPFLSDRLQLAIELGYYQSQSSDLSVDGRDRLQTLVRALPSTLRFAYAVPIDRFEIWPFLGVGALFAWSDVSSPLSGHVRASEIAPLWAAGAGGSSGLGPGRIGLELGWLDARLQRSSVRGNAAGFCATVGYWLTL